MTLWERVEELARRVGVVEQRNSDWATHELLMEELARRVGVVEQRNSDWATHELLIRSLETRLSALDDDVHDMHHATQNRSPEAQEMSSVRLCEDCGHSGCVTGSIGCVERQQQAAVQGIIGPEAYEALAESYGATLQQSAEVQSWRTHALEANERLAAAETLLRRWMNEDSKTWLARYQDSQSFLARARVATEKP